VEETLSKVKRGNGKSLAHVLVSDPLNEDMKRLLPTIILRAEIRITVIKNTPELSAFIFQMRIEGIEVRKRTGWLERFSNALWNGKRYFLRHLITIIGRFLMYIIVLCILSLALVHGSPAVEQFFSPRPCELGFPRTNDQHFHAADDDTVSILLYFMCRFHVPMHLAVLASEGVVADLSIHPAGYPSLSTRARGLPVFSPLEQEHSDGIMNTMHSEFTVRARAYLQDPSARSLDEHLMEIFGADSELRRTRYFQLAVDLRTANTSRLVDSFHTQIRITRLSPDVGQVTRSIAAAQCNEPTGDGTTQQCTLPTDVEGALTRRLDYMEIGTSDFDTLIHAAQALNREALAEADLNGDGVREFTPYEGVSVEPMTEYFQHLPVGGRLSGINAAVGSVPGYAGVYGFRPDGVASARQMLRGCSSIDGVHAAAKNVLNSDQNLSTLALIRQAVALLTPEEVFFLSNARYVSLLKVDAEGMDFRIVLGTIAFMRRFGLKLPCVINFESNSRHANDNTIQTDGNPAADFATLIEELRDPEEMNNYAIFELLYRSPGMDVNNADNTEVFALGTSPGCRSEWGRAAELLSLQQQSLFRFDEEAYTAALTEVMPVHAHSTDTVPISED